MKKSLLSILSIVAAIAGITSCSKEIVNEEVQNEPSISINVIAEPTATKATFGDKVGLTYPILWESQDALFSLDGTKAVSTTATPSSDKLTASFNVTFTNEPNESGAIYGASPVGDYKSTPVIGGFTSIYPNYAFIVIPSEQAPKANSVDPSTLAVLGSTTYKNSTIPSEIKMSFDHVLAYGKMSFVGVDGVSFSTVEIQFPVSVAGKSCKYYTNSVEEGGFEQGNIYGADLKTLVLDGSEVENNLFWFACAPTSGNAGKMVITATTSEGVVYEKTLDLTKKALPFEKGSISSFSVNLSGVTPVSKSYKLVKDVNDLTAGDVIRLGCATANKAAGALSSDFLTSVTATIANETLISDDAVDIILGGTADAWTLSIDGQVLCTSAAKKMNLQNKGTSTWTISVSNDGTATITSTDSANGTIKYNNSAPRFLNYASGQTSIQIYKKTNGVVDNRQNRNLAFSSAEVTAVIGEEFVAPTLSGVTSGVVYSSSNQDVASVASDGTVTIKAKGSANITAAAPADETYKEGVAAYKVNVVAPTITEITGTTTWAYNETETQTLTIVGTNLHGIVLDDSELEHFEVVEVDGSLLVYPIETNNSSEPYIESFTVTAVDGNKVTVKLTQNQKPTGTWVLVDFANLSSSDVFVMVADGAYAISSSNGTGSNPKAVSVTISGDVITSDVSDDMKWNVTSPESGKYKFNVAGGSTYIYNSQSSGTSVRVGSGSARYLLEYSNSKLMFTESSRYLVLYNNADFRAYTSTASTNTTWTFYKRQ